MELNRVAVTGISAICGLGNNLDEVWKNALAGKSGVSIIEDLPHEDIAVKFAGNIRNFKISNDILGEKEQPRYDKFIHYALHCTDEALKQANLDYAPEKIGAILGVGMGGFPIMEAQNKVLMDKGPRRVTPFFIPAVIPNMASGLITIKYGLKGINYTISSACASSAHSLQAAAQEIMLGRQDAIVTGGTESVISGLPLSGFGNMKALSKRNDNPEAASRPFDVGRDGFVMGEGAGILILENYDKAKARGAKILAELVGFGASSDAGHITAPHPEGLGAIQAMRQSIEDAGISPSDIGYVNAHGTSTPLGDRAETQAIKTVFGDHAYKMNVSSTKSMTGHLLGAAGGLEAVFCIKALMEGAIPPTINLDQQDELCDLNYTANKMVKKDIQYALTNSFGFGGTNGCVIFKKY
jgi:3-oxoacyl-[acyl-carrier-protein] synthase II